MWGDCDIPLGMRRPNYPNDCSIEHKIAAKLQSSSFRSMQMCERIRSTIKLTIGMNSMHKCLIGFGAFRSNRHLDCNFYKNNNIPRVISDDAKLWTINYSIDALMCSYESNYIRFCVRASMHTHIAHQCHHSRCTHSLAYVVSCAVYHSVASRVVFIVVLFSPNKSLVQVQFCW